MGIFGSSKTSYKDINPLMTQRVNDLIGTSLPGATSRIQGAGQPIPTQTAGLTGTQNKAMMSLDEFLQNGFPQGGVGEQALEGILGEANIGGQGALGPVGDAYYQAFRTSALRELQESKDRLNAATSSRDKFFGGGRIDVTGELEEDALANLLQTQAGLRNTAMDRAAGLVPTALDYGLAEADYPRRQAEAGLQLGELERGIEDIGYQREYAEQVRQLTDAGLPLEVALQLMNYRPEVSSKTSGGIGGSLAGLIAGGGLGVLTGGAIGGALPGMAVGGLFNS